MIELLNKCSDYFKLCNALSGSIVAYHCGRELSNGAFSLDFVGSGEGMIYLGPGIYFSDNEKLAREYKKYHQDPYLYKVSIQANDLYDPNRGQPMHLRDKVFEMEAALKKQLGIREDKFLDATDSFKFGKSWIGFIVEKFGRIKAISMFKDIGITGIYENLPNGVLEICVFDLSIVSILEKIKVEI